MKFKKLRKMSFIGFLTGAVNGLFGAGGGMILVPLLSRYGDLEEQEVFPSSVSIILPICLVSLSVSFFKQPDFPQGTLWYLIGSLIGGFCGGKWGAKLPALWLHRILGLFILWGGIRNLC